MSDRLERGRYIGGQQMAAIAGLHPYSTAADVYVHCVHGITDDIGDRPAVRRGNIIEPGLISWIEREALGIKPPLGLRRDVFLQDPDVPYFAGTIDAIQTRDDGELWIHEVTTASRFTLDAWGDDGDPQGASTYKWIQTQWYCGNSGAAGGTIWLYVLDSDELRSFPIPRNDDAIAALRDQAETFWLDHVIPRIPPDMTKVAGHLLARSTKALDRLYAEDPKLIRDVTPELVNIANDYHEAREASKKADDAKSAAAGSLRAMLGEATRAKWDGGSVTWNRNKGSPDTDYKRALQALVDDGEIQQCVADSTIAKHTTTKPGPRVLRVTIKPPAPEEQSTP